MKKLLITLAVLCMMLMPMLASAESERTVTVSGTATVMVEADTATVSFGIETRAKEVAAASEANAAQTQRLKQALTEAGVAEKDITTEFYYVNPIYDFNQVTEDDITPVKGYSVSNTLSIRVRDITQIGTLIDKALASGATSCNGISFSSSKAADAQDEALVAAIAEARRKAELMAEACGGKLGVIVSVSEQAGITNGALFNLRSNKASGVEEAEDAATEIVSDGLRYSATVTVVFELTDTE
ncbi:MAG: SIMPL domain-containing protein [Clostridia bacterium]|nr:SIMPL domain-containing protein [Clostridia bacterium]